MLWPQPHCECVRFFFIDCFCCVASLDSVFPRARTHLWASTVIWPSLYLVLPRTISNHESRDVKTNGGRSFEPNVVAIEIRSRDQHVHQPPRVAFYVLFRVSLHVDISHRIT